MKVPTDEEYKEFVEKLDAEKLRLTCGNCGIFAYALQKVFEIGDIFSIQKGCHLLLKYNDKYYDGENVYTWEELIDSEWGTYLLPFDEEHSKFQILDFEEDAQLIEEIKKETTWSIEPEEFIEIIKNNLKR